MFSMIFLAFNIWVVFFRNKRDGLYRFSKIFLVLSIVLVALSILMSIFLLFGGIFMVQFKGGY